MNNPSLSAHARTRVHRAIVEGNWLVVARSPGDWSLVHSGGGCIVPAHVVADSPGLIWPVPVSATHQTSKGKIHHKVSVAQLERSRTTKTSPELHPCRRMKKKMEVRKARAGRSSSKHGTEKKRHCPLLRGILFQLITVIISQYRLQAGSVLYRCFKIPSAHDRTPEGHNRPPSVVNLFSTLKPVL